VQLFAEPKVGLLGQSLLAVFLQPDAPLLGWDPSAALKGSDRVDAEQALASPFVR
jgi:hypothetical protein